MDRHLGSCIACNRPEGETAITGLKKLSFQISPNRHDSFVGLCNACFETLSPERIEELVGMHVDGIEDWKPVKSAVLAAVKTELRQMGRLPG